MGKVTFDGINKLINVNVGETELFFDTDVYFPFKNWIIDNFNFYNAIQKIGGETVLANQIYASYAFILMNGWKIKPFNSQHILTIKSNVYSYDGSQIYITTLNVIVNVETDVSGGLTLSQSNNLSQISTQVTEVWKLLGLDNTSPVFVSKIGRITSDIAQTFQSDTASGNVIITRE